MENLATHICLNSRSTQHLATWYGEWFFQTADLLIRERRRFNFKINKAIPPDIEFELKKYEGRLFAIDVVRTPGSVYSGGMMMTMIFQFLKIPYP